MRSGKDDLASASGAPWQVSRVDLRSPVSRDAWPLARVELQHHERGRITDIASAPGAFDAAFAAAAQILRIAPILLRYDVRSPRCDAHGTLCLQVEIDLALDGALCRGSATGIDLVECSLRAWLDAACASPERLLRAPGRMPDRRNQS